MVKCYGMSNLLPYYSSLPLRFTFTLSHLHVLFEFLTSLNAKCDSLKCLLKSHLVKWRNVLSTRISSLGLERELEAGLYCGHCLPSCDDTHYDISMMSLPTDRLRIPDNIGDDLNLKVEDMSVLRVYFAAFSAPFYKREINNKWEEAFSTVGNIVSIFLGFSMVAVFEIILFVLKYFAIALKVFISSSKDNTNILKKGFKVKNKQLYILP